MQFLFCPNNALPAQSWAAVITGELVTIHHGLLLEHGEDWLVDGCWAGAFAGGLPQNDEDPFFAFALRDEGDSVRIDCPSHLLERLFLLRKGDRLIVSPSIPFVLALGKAELNPAYPDYVFDFLQSIRSKDQNCGSLPLADGRSLEFFSNRRLHISKNLDVRVVWRHMERTFRVFKEYEEFLIRNLHGLRDNAASPARRAGRYGLCSTISRGYDSVALSALAAEAGAKVAGTFPGEDSGAEIGARLGLEVREIQCDAYLRKSGIPEAEFLATGFKGEDIVLSGGESLFKGNLVVVGMYGDVMWDRSRQDITTAEVRMRVGNGCALGEFRWRVGTLFAPIACCGAQSVVSVKALAESAEMKPWSLGETYDRPIPRRLAEERGVLRGTFADKKRGMFVMSFAPREEKDLEKLMTPEGHASFRDFVARQAWQRSLSLKLERQARYWAYRTERFVGRKLQDAGILKEMPNSFDPRHQVIPAAPSFLFPWAVEIMKQRYAAGLAGV